MLPSRDCTPSGIRLAHPVRGEPFRRTISRSQVPLSSLAGIDLLPLSSPASLPSLSRIDLLPLSSPLSSTAGGIKAPIPTPPPRSRLHLAAPASTSSLLAVIHLLLAGIAPSSPASSWRGDASFHHHSVIPLLRVSASTYGSTTSSRNNASEIKAEASLSSPCRHHGQHHHSAGIKARST